MSAFAVGALAADYATVRQDIANITTLLQELDADANAIAPGIAGLPRALQLQVDAVNLHKRLLSASDNAEASPPFGGGSLSVGLDLIQLEPKISDTLQDIVDKNDALGELGIIVLSSLYQLKQDTDEFGDAIVEKLGALEQAIAPVIIRRIETAFNNAIVAYGGNRKCSLWLNSGTTLYLHYSLAS
jgi:hypothetical protein